MLRKPQKRIKVNQEDHAIDLGDKPINHHKQETRHVCVVWLYVIHELLMTHQEQSKCELNRSIRYELFGRRCHMHQL